ncbi:MAG: putative bifunctional diguanylate cyclase/phosphodiesterase [Gammaproteobacteria bacterium]
MRISLTAKMVLSVVVIQLVMLGVILWNSLRIINDNYVDLLEASVKEKSNLMSVALAPGILASDRAMVDDVLHMLKENHSLVFLELFDHEGKHIASQGNFENRILTDSAKEFQVIYKNDFLEFVRKLTVDDQDLGLLHAVYDTRALQRLTHDMRWQSILISILTLALLMLATVLMGIMLSSNLRRLKHAVLKIQQGDYSQVLALSDAKEFDELAIAFNKMTGHLHVAQMQLENKHQAMARQSGHLKAMLNSVNAVIWQANATNGDLIFVSQDAEGLLGYPIEQWYGPGFLLHKVYADDYPMLKDSLESLRIKHRQINIDIRLLHLNQKLIWVRIIASSENDQDSQCQMIRGLILNIEYEKSREQKIIYLAEHDALTGLMNRRSFQENLNSHVAYGSRYGHSSALFFIDLDHFKYINDTYGHSAGDGYLLQIADRLKNSIRETDVLGRLGGDEFGVILPFADHQEATKVADNLLHALSGKSWNYDGKKVRMSASIGITLFPKKNKSPEDFLTEADSAMYVAKSLGRNRSHMFDENDANMAKMHSKVDIENMIRDALSANAFELHLQPIIDLLTGDTCHYEVLLRINEASGKLIMAEEFIDTAERFGLIQDIDRWVFGEIINLIAENIQNQVDAVYAVNLSGVSIEDNEFREWIRDRLINNNEVARHLVIEITEMAAVKSISIARSLIMSLSELGCQFAIDKFGVGFSSFHYIKNLPVDYIKIDGSFVHRLHLDDIDHVFVKAAIDIARGLGIKTIAESVENERIMQLLKELNADYGQGYFMGCPKKLNH